MLLAAIRKEVLQLLADRGALASMFLMPLAFIVFFGFVFKGGGDDGEGRPIAVYYQDGDATAERIVAAMSESGAFAPDRRASADEVRARVAAEDVLVGLIIPRELGPGGEPAELVIDEASSPQFRGPIEGAVRGLIGRAFAPPGAASDDGSAWLVVATPPGMGKPLQPGDAFQITVPGNALLFSFFIAVTVALGFVEERRQGTFRRLLAAPVGRPKVLLAKLVPYYIVGVIQMAFLFGVGAGGFGMTVGGSLVALCAITAASVFCAVSLGLLIASFGGSEKQVGGFASLAVLVMGLLGGAMVPRIVMPDSIQSFGLFVPHGWALDAYYDVLMRTGTTVADVATPIAVLCGFGAAFAAFGAARFKFE